MGTALKEGLPLKLVKHQGDAVSAAVVCGHKSGGSSLYHFELAGQFFSVENVLFCRAGSHRQTDARAGDTVTVPLVTGILEAVSTRSSLALTNH